MLSIKRAMQHLLNPLHVYCRLRAAGVDTATAQRLCLIYERFVYRIVLAG